MAGYQNRILRVDLTKRTFSEGSLSKELIHSFVGGRGFGVKLLYDELQPGIDPLGEESQLIFVSGPLAGTNAQSFGRYKVFLSHLSPVVILSPVAGGTWRQK